MERKKTLHIISAAYPYGSGEHFVQKELNALTHYFDTIYIYPQTRPNNVVRPMPENVVLNPLLYTTPGRVEKRVFFSNFLFILKILCTEFIHTKRKRYFISRLRTWSSTICQALQKGELLMNEFGKADAPGVYFYSIWRDEGALIFSILKDKGRIPFYDFKYHGFDLYDEEKEGYYQRFGYYTLKHARTAFHISKAGYDYMIAKNMFPEKMKLFYSGVYDNGINQVSAEDVFTIMSCGNVVPLKRIDRALDIISRIPFPCIWYHVGEGSQRAELEQRAKSLPPHIEVKFLGRLTNPQVIETYRTVPVHLFIHLSRSEGGAPVAIQEAISFGIPVIGAAAGGTPEIVNEHTGILVPGDFTDEEVVEAIIRFRNSPMNTQEFRRSVKEYWNMNFNANRNFKLFAEYLAKK